MRIAITGGGSGGHVFNALSLAERLRMDHGAEVTFIGSADGQEARLVPEAGYVFHAVHVEKMVRELSPRTLRAPIVALRSVGEARRWVAGRDAVVGMGGYVSAPAVIAARRTRIPVVLHEQNAVPGLANRLLAWGAAAAGLTFADAAGRLPRRLRTVVTGNPVRDQIRAVLGARDTLAAEAVRAFDLDPTRRTVLVTGGSQGALHLNEAVIGLVDVLGHRADLQLLVSTGSTHLATVEQALRARRPLQIHAFGFIERMDLAYAAADLAVARAGANTVTELTVCGVPSILVPYPHATENHQEANARELVRVGAAEILHDSAMTPEVLASRIEAALGDRPRLTAMREAAVGWAKPDADRRLSELVVGVAV